VGTKIHHVAKFLLSRLLLVLFSLGFIFAVLEVAARLIPLWPDQLSEYDPNLGFAHIPGVEGKWINIAVPFEFRTDVNISSQGLNDREFTLEKAEGTKRVLLLGDSYIDGLEVSQEETTAKQLEKLLNDGGGLNTEVINGGHYNYGTDQALLFYRHRGRQFQPDVVVLGFFPGNDISDNLRTDASLPKPYFKLADEGVLELMNFPVQPPSSSSPGSLIGRAKQLLNDHSKLFRFTSYQIKRHSPPLQDLLIRLGVMSEVDGAVSSVLLTELEGVPEAYQATTEDLLEEGWALTAALVLQLKMEVESSGSEFVLVILPDPRQFVPEADLPGWDVTKWNERMMDLCLMNEIECLDLYPAFKTTLVENPDDVFFYPRDGHPTARGHFQIAQELHDYLVIGSQN
jgi:hypothetical protein